MTYALEQTLAPVGHLLTFDEVKTYLRVDANDEQATILAIVDAAEAFIEVELGDAKLRTQTWKEYRDTFPAGRGIIRPRLWPVASVESVKYTDTDDSLETFTDWQLDAVSQPARLLPSPDFYWPTDEKADTMNAVVLETIVGWATVPHELTLAAKILTAHWFENREPTADGTIAEVPLSVRTLIDHHRIPRL